MNRWKLLVLLVVCFTQWGFSQVNLVPNGGFELFDSCPNSFADLDEAQEWDVLVGSPDYFHSCSPGLFSTPNNSMGYQESDSGYIGLYGYSSTFVGGEVAFVELSETLVAGVKYRVRLKASIADSSNYSICCLDVRLSSTPPPSPPFAQDYFSVSLVIPDQTDTTTWFQLDTLYTATGGEDRLYLGSFRPEVSLNPLLIRPNGTANYDRAYFYIDDVEVYEDDLVSLKPNKATEFNLRTLAGSQLEVEVSESMNMTLLDVSGRAVLSERLLSGTSTLDVSRLPNGLYIAAFQEPNGNWAGTRKVVLQQ